MGSDGGGGGNPSAIRAIMAHVLGVEPKEPPTEAVKGLVGNALSLAGFSWGNIASKLARPFLGAAGAEMLGIAIDLKRGNIGGVIHNSMDLMEALNGKKAGCAGAHSCDRPSGIIGGVLKAGFTAAAVLGGGALIGGLLSGTAMGGLGK